MTLNSSFSCCHLLSAAITAFSSIPPLYSIEPSGGMLSYIVSIEPSGGMLSYIVSIEPGEGMLSNTVSIELHRLLPAPSPSPSPRKQRLSLCCKKSRVKDFHHPLFLPQGPCHFLGQQKVLGASSLWDVSGGSCCVLGSGPVSL